MKKGLPYDLLFSETIHRGIYSVCLGSVVLSVVSKGRLFVFDILALLFAFLWIARTRLIFKYHNIHNKEKSENDKSQD